MTNTELTPQNTRLGFVGIGVMGNSMCGHLLTKGTHGFLHRCSFLALF